MISIELMSHTLIVPILKRYNSPQCGRSQNGIGEMGSYGVLVADMMRLQLVITQIRCGQPADDEAKFYLHDAKT
jgi:hypothetical protein